MEKKNYLAPECVVEEIENGVWLDHSWENATPGGSDGFVGGDDAFN